MKHFKKMMKTVAQPVPKSLIDTIWYKLYDIQISENEKNETVFFASPFNFAMNFADVDHEGHLL